MCLAAVGPILTIGSSILSYIGQSQQTNYENQLRAQQAQYNNQNLFYQERQGAQQEYYKGVEAEQKLRQEQMQTEAGAATARTAAGEAGVTGISVDDLQREYYLRQGEFDKDVKFNRDASVDEIQTQLQGLKNQTEAENNQLGQLPGPSPLGILLGIGQGASGAVKGYTSSLKGTGTSPSFPGFWDYLSN
jgi:hypothetical protein